jgi:hypothetical protein
LAAANGGEPFWVIFDKYPHPIGYDVAAGLLRDPEGELLMVIYTTDSPAVPGAGDPTLWQERCAELAPPLIRDVPIRCVPAA